MYQKPLKIALIVILTILFCYLVGMFFNLGHQKNISKNGFKIIYRKEESPFVAVSIFLEGGKREEATPGLANFTLTMLNNGTTNKSKEQIASTLDNIGGNISYQLTNDFTSFTGIALKEKATDLLDLMSELLLSPSFPEKELFRTKKEIIAEIQQQNENPFLYAIRLNRQSNYPNHYYGRNKLGTEKDIENISKIDCLNFHKTLLNNSQQVVIVINGDIKYSKLSEKIKFLTTQIKTSTKTSPLALPGKPTGNNTFQGKHSTNIILCNYAIPTANYTQYALGNLASDYLGGGLSSPIFTATREKNGMGYAVGSFYDFQKYDSLLIVYIQTLLKDYTQNNQVIDQAISEIEINKKELAKAKRHLLTKYYTEQQALSKRGYTLGYNEVIGLGLKYNYEQNLKAISVKQLKDFLKQLTHLNSFILQ